MEWVAWTKPCVKSGRALAIDRAPVRLVMQGFVLYMNSRHEEAEAMLEEGLAMDTAGDVHYLRTVRASQMLLDGRYREAIERWTCSRKWPPSPCPAGFGTTYGIQS